VGCAASVVEASITPTGSYIWDGYTFHKYFDFKTLTGHTKYPFMLLTSQHITERILGQQVKERKIDVYRPCRVANLQVNRENPEYTDVIFEDGQVVKANYVVGADGARSIVRGIVCMP
jgi:2-polyprenyl-6-methoxyphenol hydroxylase-like FAD-dependent oxidoreductase